MALYKEKTNHNTGVVTKYHKFHTVSLTDNTLYCVLLSYTSKNYRLNGENTDTETYLFQITVEEEEAMGIRQLAYKKLKELVEWTGAEDC